MTVLDHRRFLAQDYALINPLQVPLDQRRDLPTIRLSPQGLERHGRMMPLLLRLNALPETQRLELMERSDYLGLHYDMPLFAALLECKADIPILKAHLLSRMIVKRRTGPSAWLRFHDPRVYRHLRWLLSTDQMTGLMGPIEHWTWYEPLMAQWHTQRRPDGNGLRNLFVADDLWMRLERLEDLNVALRNLANDDTPTDDDTAQRLLDGLLDARQRGLTQTEDVLLYARQYLQHGPDWHGNEVAKRCIRQAVERRSSYISAWAEFAGHGQLQDHATIGIQEGD